MLTITSKYTQYVGANDAQAGDLVLHPTHGIGVVMGMAEDGPDTSPDVVLVGFEGQLFDGRGIYIQFQNDDDDTCRRVDYASVGIIRCAN